MDDHNCDYEDDNEDLQALLLLMDFGLYLSWWPLTCLLFIISGSKLICHKFILLQK